MANIVEKRRPSIVHEGLFIGWSVYMRELAPVHVGDHSFNVSAT
jgi:hypothetical protein